MPSSNPNVGIALWFTHLRHFQTACNNTAVNAMDLLTFADAVITAVLPSPTEQSTFLVNAAKLTGFDDIASADLTTFKNFEGLLDFYYPLITPLAMMLQSLAGPSVQGVSGGDFMSSLVSAAFPGGSTGIPWTNAMKSLASNIPAICFSAKFQASINASVDKANTKMGDLIAAIAVLG